MTDPLQSDDLRDVAAAARRLLVSCETVRAWIRTGKIRAIRLPGGHYRIRHSEITRILDNQAHDAQVAQDAQKEQDAQKAQTQRRTRRKQAQART